jgi:hypothetical protein
MYMKHKKHVIPLPHLTQNSLDVQVFNTKKKKEKKKRPIRPCMLPYCPLHVPPK